MPVSKVSEVVFYCTFTFETVMIFETPPSFLSPLFPHPGTVALCAGCNVFEAWAAVVVGAVSGPLFLLFQFLLLRMKVKMKEIY